MDNITYSHEHIVIDLSKEKHNDDCKLNIYEDALDELKDLYQKGVRRMVDCSNHGIGVNRDINHLVEEATGIKIINSTGFYKDPFLPEWFKNASLDDLVQIMLEDIDKYECKVIGEIGTSNNEWTENEKKLFKAATIVQKKTNTVIITHTTLGSLAFDQVRYLKSENINLKKVVISHAALSKDLNMIREVLKEGANVAFDTIGKLSYLDDDTRACYIKELIDEGYKDQLLMSMDITRKSHLKKNGGVGYSYLLDEFIPLLISKGIKKEDIEDIMCHNFENILGA